MELLKSPAKTLIKATKEDVTKWRDNERYLPIYISVYPFIYLFNLYILYLSIHSLYIFLPIHPLDIFFIIVAQSMFSLIYHHCLKELELTRLLVYWYIVIISLKCFVSLLNKLKDLVSS